VTEVWRYSFKRHNEEEKGNVVPVHAMKAYRRNGSIGPFILNLGAKLRCLVNVTPRLLYHQQRTPVPIEYEAGGPWSSSGRLGKEKTSCSCRENKKGDSTY
jgi:hypothetical protein